MQTRDIKQNIWGGNNPTRQGKRSGTGRLRGAIGMLAALLVAAPNLAAAAPLDLADTPLTVATFGKPNILLLMDDSGSMNNIVPEAPYDPDDDTWNTCTAVNAMGTASTIDVRITSGGAPFFRAGGTTYAWGTAGGSTAGGEPIKCFDPTADYDARLHGNGGGSGTRYPSGYLDAVYTGHYLNWYFGSAPTAWGSGANRKPGTQIRMDIAQTATNGLLDSLAALPMRIGLASYNGGSGASINQSINDITNTTHFNNLKSSVDALSPSGSTPLAESLRDIGDYFSNGYSGNFRLRPDSDNTTVAKGTLFSRNYSFNNPGDVPVQNWCEKNFVVAVSDGRPQSDQNMSASLADYDGDCDGASPACDTHDRKTAGGYEYESAGSDYLDDVAQAWFEMDLRPDLDDFDGNEVKNNITTFMVGFADDQVINDPLIKDAGTQGGGGFLTAKDAPGLTSALSDALRTVEKKTGTFASVAVNSATLVTESRIFQGTYTSGEWSGDLRAIEFNLDGTIGAEIWSARTQISNQNYLTGREIITYDDNASTGIPFAWGNLNVDQKTALRTHPVTGANETDAIGEDRLNYVRGDHSNELRNSGTFRNRPDDFVMGDVVDSGPFYVASPPILSDAGDALEAVPHSSFRNANLNRTPVIYVGANAGVFHAIDAATGNELLGYVPNLVFDNLNQLTSTHYNHLFYLNATPTVGDAFFGGAWHTVLAASPGRGGKGVFALDITDPSLLNEAQASNLVLWEFTDADDMGYFYGTPTIAKMHNGDWAAIFGNGYNSTNERAVLFIVNIATGALIRKIDLSDADGTGNGLSMPAAIDVDGDLVADYIFAGDLLGNMWKIDVTDNNENQWGSFWKSGGDPTEPFFQARDGNGEVQPITEQPEITFHPDELDGFMVYFGTGKFLESDDVTPNAAPVQTFYGLWDFNPAADTDRTISGDAAIERADLLPQILDTETFTSGNVTAEVRTVTDTPISWKVNDTDVCETDGTGFCMGWRVDLNITGEMSISNPIFFGGDIPRIIFTTIIPSGEVCSFGGDSWLMELNPRNGGRLPQNVFDLNGDGVFDEEDLLVDPDPTSGTAPGQSMVGGVKTENGLNPAPTIVTESPSGNEIATFKKLLPGTSGEIQIIDNLGASGDVGRQSWRELR